MLVAVTPVSVEPPLPWVCWEVPAPAPPVCDPPTWPTPPPPEGPVPPAGPAPNEPDDVGPVVPPEVVVPPVVLVEPGTVAPGEDAERAPACIAYWRCWGVSRAPHATLTRTIAAIVAAVRTLFNGASP